jgi:hypothetical protein
MSENQNNPPQNLGDQEKVINDPRFWIATVLILGLLIILIISVLQAQYTQTTQLAAIFSGWITSIIAFYFYTQTSSQLQNQIKTSAQSEAQAHQSAEAALQRAQTAEKTVNSIKGVIAGSEPVEALVAEADKAKATQETIENIKTILQREET